MHFLAEFMVIEYKKYLLPFVIQTVKALRSSQEEFFIESVEGMKLNNLTTPCNTVSTTNSNDCTANKLAR